MCCRWALSGLSKKRCGIPTFFSATPYAALPYSETFLWKTALNAFVSNLHLTKQAAPAICKIRCLDRAAEYKKESLIFSISRHRRDENRFTEKGFAQWPTQLIFVQSKIGAAGDPCRTVANLHLPNISRKDAFYATGAVV